MKNDHIIEIETAIMNLKKLLQKVEAGKIGKQEVAVMQREQRALWKLAEMLKHILKAPIEVKESMLKAKIIDKSTLDIDVNQLQAKIKIAKELLKKIKTATS
jgi:hypothetical protein